MKEELESEFASKMKEIAKQVTLLAKDQPQKSVILIATESDDDDTTIMVTATGRSGELAKGIAEFATNEESKKVFDSGLKLAQTK